MRAFRAMRDAARLDDVAEQPEVAEQLAITDAFVITSGANDRQVKSIVDEVEGVVFFVMALVDGESVSARLRRDAPQTQIGEGANDALLMALAKPALTD